MIIPYPDLHVFLPPDEWYMPAYRQGRHPRAQCPEGLPSSRHLLGIIKPQHERCEGARAGMTTELVYIDTSSVAPGVSFRVLAAIRISIAPPSTSVACTVPPAMRMATVRPLQRTRNDRLRH